MKEITRGDYIREIREYLGLRREELGDMVGISIHDICQYETGIRAVSELEWKGFVLAFFEYVRRLHWECEIGMSDEDIHEVEEKHWQIVDMLVFNNDLSFFEKRIRDREEEKKAKYHNWYGAMKDDLDKNGAIGVEVKATADSDYLYAIFKLAARNKVYICSDSLYMISKHRYTFEEAKDIVSSWVCCEGEKR